MLKNGTLKIIGLIFFLQNLQAQSHQNFREDVEKYAEILRLPTLAVGVAKGDSLIFYKGIGSASSKMQVPITEDHVFAIASITKTFTSVILHQLEVEGHISLDDFIDNYPNNFFNTNRWNKNTTVAHILSHTSESHPIGTNFVYNGSKFNLVFNVFSKLNADIGSENVTRPFTIEIEQRILDPLGMKHSLVQYDESEHSQLKKYVVAPYSYNESKDRYEALSINLPGIQSGPAYGMMSSLNDLIKYSNGLDNEKIMSTSRYKRMTSPFYSNSLHGLGWFTYNFGGFEIHWAYGYGNNDSAILLKVPSKNLTLVLLSSCTMPSESTRLGYGNPLNSPIIASFLNNYVLNLPHISQYDNKVDSIAENIRKNNAQNNTRIYTEQAFAIIVTTLFSPITNSDEKEKSTKLLKLLIKNYPNDPIWQSTTAIELIATSDDKELLNFGSGITRNFNNTQGLHPATIYYAGIIQEKLNKRQSAIRLFKMLSDQDIYQEQDYKFDALMKLAKYFIKSQPEISKRYLKKLIELKEFISVQDELYNDAISMLSKI